MVDAYLSALSINLHADYLVVGDGLDPIHFWHQLRGEVDLAVNAAQMIDDEFTAEQQIDLLVFDFALKLNTD